MLVVGEAVIKYVVVSLLEYVNLAAMVEFYVVVAVETYCKKVVKAHILFVPLFLASETLSLQEGTET